jgi:hypothetical protein
MASPAAFAPGDFGTPRRQFLEKSTPITGVLERGREGRFWPIAEMPAGARRVRLLALNLPARKPFVNPDSAHRGRRREAGRSGRPPASGMAFDAGLDVAD